MRQALQLYLLIRMKEIHRRNMIKQEVGDPFNRRGGGLMFRLGLRVANAFQPLQGFIQDFGRSHRPRLYLFGAIAYNFFYRKIGYAP